MIFNAPLGPDSRLRGRGGTMTGRPLPTSGVGRWISTLGGVLCVVGYFLPWVTYHPDSEGYLRNLPWSGWTTAWSALGEAPRSLLAANVINAVVPSAFLCACLLPLVAGMLALLVGTRAWLGISWQIPGRLYWSVVALGTLALLLMTYSLDPWGWS